MTDISSKSIEQQLAEALAEVEKLKTSLAAKDDMIAGLRKTMSYLEEDMLEAREELSKALARGDRMLDRINNPYKYHHLTSGY